MARWRKRLPPKSVMTGAPKGRSIKALREKVQRLQQHENTAELGARLRRYLQTVTYCDMVRPKNVQRLPASELTAIVADLKADGIELTGATHTALLDHKVTEALKMGCPRNLMLIIQPWISGDTTFDPLAPLVATIAWPLSARIDTFKRCMFGRHLAMLIQAGESKSFEVREAAINLEEFAEKQDLFELEDAAASVLVGECSVAAKILKALKAFPLDPTIAEDVERLYASKGRPKSALSSLLSCLQGAPFWADRLTALKHALPSIVELGPKMQTHLEDLDGLPKDMGLRTIDVVNAASTTMIACRTSGMPQELLNPLADATWAFIVDLWMTIKADDQKLLRSADACALRRFVAALTNIAAAFPTKLLVSEIELAAKAVESQITSGTLLASLVTQLEALPTPLDADPNIMKTATDSALECIGLHPSNEQAATINEAIGKVIAEVLPQCGVEAKADFVSAGIELWEKLAAVADTKEHMMMSQLVSLYIQLLSVATEFQDLDKKDPDCSDIECRSQLLHRSKVCSLQCSAMATKCDEVLTFQPFKQFLEFVRTCMQKVGSAQVAAQALVVSSISKALQLAQDAVVLRMGAHSGEQVWHANVAPKANFETLAAAAKDKLATLDLQGLATDLTSLERAGERYKAIMEMAGVDSDTQLPETYDKLFKKAIVLRVEAALFWHFSAERSADPLRTKVCAEVKTLRSIGLQEKSVLHSALFARCLAAIRMQPGASSGA